VRRERAISAIRGRLHRVTSGPDGVLAPNAEAEAEALAGGGPAAPPPRPAADPLPPAARAAGPTPDPTDVEAAYLLGSWHWWRHHLLAESEHGWDGRAAIAWFTRVFPLRPDLVPEQLRPGIARIAEPFGDSPADWEAEATRLLADPLACSSRDVLDRVVRLLEAVVAQTPADEPELPSRLSNLGNALLVRSRRSSSIHDLDRAIVAFDQAAAATPDDDPGLVYRLDDLGAACQLRFEAAGDPTSLDRVVWAYARAVAATPSEHPGRPAFLARLAQSYAVRFGLASALADLYRAITRVQCAV
jgi:hypothetical protein